MKLKPWELLDLLGVYKCPECRCATGGDWVFKDFSNNNTIICPQCNHEIEITEGEVGETT